MRLPRLFRTTAFRMTLLFLALFASAASAFLAYIYVATAGEVTDRADAQVRREMVSLERVYSDGGLQALNAAVIERSAGDHPLLYLLMTPAGVPISGTIGASPVPSYQGQSAWASFVLTDTGPGGGVIKKPARGLEEKLAGGPRLFVGADVGESEAYVRKIIHALWGAGALIIILGLAGGLLISRDVSRNAAALTTVIDRARSGDLAARAPIRGVGDEYDDLAVGLNDMLDR
ncbi:MAG TPA: methyl-accepting chemotaxis protein, partial [Caulobacteraceae bacterium]|nr:methyl-accepting chemotaxis protein [Caulobacteraceae bacterium]